MPIITTTADPLGPLHYQGVYNHGIYYEGQSVTVFPEERSQLLAQMGLLSDK